MHWAAAKSERVLSAFLNAKRNDQGVPSSTVEDTSSAEYVKRPAKLDFDLPDDRGRTPLMIATGEGNHSNVAALLEAGANPLRRDDDGNSAVDYVLLFIICCPDRAAPVGKITPRKYHRQS